MIQFALPNGQAIGQVATLEKLKTWKVRKHLPLNGPSFLGML